MQQKNRRNHGPLTKAEKIELWKRLSAIHLSRQQAIQEGLNCLPPHMRERAKLDWYRRWEMSEI